MHLLLRSALLLRLGDVMRVDARERHSKYSRVVHGLVAPQNLALSFKALRGQPFAYWFSARGISLLKRGQEDPGLKMRVDELDQLLWRIRLL
jgi:hypothetical protein